jgi:hypothetical protein
VMRPSDELVREAALGVRRGYVTLRGLTAMAVAGTTVEGPGAVG